MGQALSAEAELDDAELVSRALRGTLADRHQAFEALLVRYDRVVRALLMSLCRNAAEADDLAQDAMLRAWTHLHTLRDGARFGAWLKQLAYRAFLHRYRRAQLESRHAHSEQVAAETEPPQELRHVWDDSLEPLMAQCSKAEQELLILLYAFEFTFAELAEARDEPVGSLKSQVHRIKARLRRTEAAAHQAAAQMDAPQPRAHNNSGADHVI